MVYTNFQMVHAYIYDEKNLIKYCVLMKLQFFSETCKIWMHYFYQQLEIIRNNNYTYVKTYEKFLTISS